MSQLRLSTAEGWQSLYERIRFNPTLEALALRRLAELDMEGCRTAFGMLLERLDLPAARHQRREVVLLLLDLLQQVNRKLHRSPLEQAAYQEQRIGLLDQFATCEDPEKARSAFIPALNRLLMPPGVPGQAGHPIVERAQAYVEENYSRRLSLSVLSSELRVSSNYLSRLFRRETGSTLTSYIHRVRLEHALLLLASGGRSLSEVAYLVGYQNYRDFYRNFVKHENASPRQVQRRLRVETRERASAALPLR